MKFNKLLVGLMGFPLLLTSCNTALTFEKAKNWIEENYPKEAIEVRAVPCISWDYSATKGTDATKKIEEIFKELKIVADYEKIEDYIIPDPDIDRPAIGQQRIIPDEDRPTQMMHPLIASLFEPFSTKAEDDVYKVNNGCFSVTYKNGIECFGHNDEGEYNVYSTSVRVFNKTGYCTDFGYKANKYMDKDNTVKFKFLIHFEYENDPID